MGQWQLKPQKPHKSVFLIVSLLQNWKRNKKEKSQLSIIKQGWTLVNRLRHKKLINLVKNDTLCSSHLLKLLLVFLPVALLHVSLLGFCTAERDEALEALQVFMLVWIHNRFIMCCCFQEADLKGVIAASLTGMNRGSRRSIQSDGFVGFCRLFRGWIWQAPSHHDLLYVQDLRVHGAMFDVLPGVKLKTKKTRNKV